MQQLCHEGGGEMSDDNYQQNLATQIDNHHKSGAFDKALAISARALESNPVDLEAYRSRWRLVADMFSEEDAKQKIRPEIESLLRTHPETPEVLNCCLLGIHGPPRSYKECSRKFV